MANKPILDFATATDEEIKKDQHFVAQVQDSFLIDLRKRASNAELVRCENCKSLYRESQLFDGTGKAFFCLEFHVHVSLKDCCDSWKQKD